MSTVNLPCVSLATGTLGPDLRVNYEFGMVLGLNEFVQEQLYFLEKDYLHERALHGYGTVDGLNVTASRPSDAPNDVTVQVDTGIAIDQFGREIVIRSPQCARLGAWLASQLQLSADAITSHLGVSGELTVYVVARYADCPDSLVPLPGQPCSSSAQTEVPSRLRDAWDIELRWERPAMPAWDTIIALARLLDSIVIDPGLPQANSDEEAITAAVRALAPGAMGSFPDPGSLPGPIVYRLPAATAAEALDRILTVWVTEVRPQLAPSLIQPDPSWDPAVLLAAITFVPAPVSSTPDSVEILSFGDPDDTGRPYLLSTQLIQELRPLPAATRANQELVTFSTVVDADGQATLTAWFHLDEPVTLPERLQATRPDGSPVPMSATPQGQAPSNLWTLSSANGGFHDGDLFAISFDTTQVTVGPAAVTLADTIAAQNLELVGHITPDQVVAYAEVDVPANAQEFVTITTVVDPSFGVSLLAWFHLDEPVTLPNFLQVATPGGGSTSFATSGVGGEPSDQWSLTSGNGGFHDGDLFAISFDTTQVTVGTEGVTLAAKIASEHLELVGHIAPTQVVAYAEVIVPTAPQQEPPPRFPVSSLVTVTPGPQANQLELWFHIDLSDRIRPGAKPLEVTEAAVRVYAEQQGALFDLSANVTGHSQPNVFVVTLRKSDKLPPPYLRVVIDGAKTTVDTTPALLAELLMQPGSPEYVGWNPDTAEIIVYARVGGFLS